jgi:hypothetical protein
MSSLVYLVVTNVKNRFLEIVRSPRKLTVYLLIIGAIIGIFVLSLFTREAGHTAGGNFLDMIWLKGIIFALTLLFFIIAISKGLKKGDTIFGMNDVNFLFVSPLNPRAILLYGVVRMMGMAFLAGFFILFQGNSLGMNFGASFGDIFIIFAMFIFAVCIMQIISLLIYSLTNNSPKGKLLVKSLAIIMFVPMVAYGIWLFATHGDVLAALETLLRSSVTSWTPVVGWSAAASFAFLTGELLTGFLFTGVMLIAAAILIAAIMLSNPDYYEDVLVATETAFEKQRAKEEGGLTEEVAVRTAKATTKPLKGNGANAFFYKHLRESFRANPLGVWGVLSVLFVIIAIGVAVIIRLNDGGAGSIAILLQSFMWAQLFMVGMGRGIMELSSHHIYMLPASAFSKLIWNNAESVMKVTGESLFMFVPAGIILGASPLLITSTVLAYIAFTLMLIGVWYLILRFTGLIANQGILILVYVFIVLVLILPGLVPAIIIGTGGAAWSAAAGTGILALWQAIAALVCFWLSRGVLHKCDMPSMKLWK